MSFEVHQTAFDSMAQWHAWRLGLDLAPPRPEATAEEQAYRRFYGDFLADVCANGQAYGVFQAVYEDTIPEDKLREDRLREARQKARKAIEGGLVDFLFQIGRVANLRGNTLQIDRPFFDELVAEKIKKANVKGIPHAFERLGLSLGLNETAHVTISQYPGASAGLAWLAKACAALPEYGFYFFRRCDFGVLDGKRQPLFEDGFRLLPGDLAEQVRRTDELLRERKFKHELFVADGDGGYRVRYQKRKGNLAYWSRIRSWSSMALDHNLRWDFAGDLTPRLFERLDAAQPGLAGQVFQAIKKCTHCYTNCLVRKTITHHGETQEICQETGWQMYGGSGQDFENLRGAIVALDELASQKK
ncbi:MAG: hypothetical protein ACOYYS_11505 [Chloroflexota bacterium]